MHLITEQMPCLKDLGLDEIDLLQGAWPNVFQALRERDPPVKLNFAHEFDNYLYVRGKDCHWCDGSGKIYSDIKNYVNNGGRHSCLPVGEPDSAATNPFQLGRGENG